MDLKKNEDNSCERCIVCGYPINRRIDKETSKKFVKGIKKWIKEKSNRETSERIAKKLNFLQNKEINICRYDFLLIIKNIIESEDAKLGKKFEDILKIFDFGESLIS